MRAIRSAREGWGSAGRLGSDAVLVEVTGPPRSRDGNGNRTAPVLTAKVGRPAVACTVQETIVRSILLMFLGVPIPVILLLALCTHHF